jgi:hypothetical protein
LIDLVCGVGRGGVSNGRIEVGTQRRPQRTVLKTQLPHPAAAIDLQTQRIPVLQGPREGLNG